MSDQRFMQRDTTENPFPSVGKTIVIHGLSSKPKLAFGSQSSSQRSDRRPLDTERVRWGVERMGLDGFCIETGINSCKSTKFMQTVPSTILSMRRNTFPAQKYLSSTPKLALAAKERILEIFSPNRFFELPQISEKEPQISIGGAQWLQWDQNQPQSTINRYLRLFLRHLRLGFHDDQNLSKRFFENLDLVQNGHYFGKLLRASFPTAPDFFHR